MYQLSNSSTAMDFWGKEFSVFASSSSDEVCPKVRTSPDSEHRSSSPDSWTQMDRSHSPTEKAFTGQQTIQAYQTSAPYQRQQVSYLPEAVNTTWKPVAPRVSAFEKPSAPKKYVFEASQCCATPRIRLVHECCNLETPGREVVDERAFPKRAYPAPKVTLCRFCLKNGEPPSVYYSHSLHFDDGRVACPVLRRYDCPICQNGGGDYAHTVRYCPALRAGIRR